MSDERALQTLRAAFDTELEPEPTDSLLVDRAVAGALASLAAGAAVASAAHAANTANAANAANASSQLAAAVVARASVTKMVLPFVAGAVFSIAGGALYLAFRDAPAASTNPGMPPAALVKPAPVAPVAPAAAVVEESQAMAIDDLPKLPASERVEPAASAVVAPVAGETAAELFRAANAARRAGEVDTAIAGYRALATQFPGVGESRAARVSLGMLLLDKKGDATGALREFDAYLAGGSRDTLAEEARLGRALAFQRLGRADEERRAWHTLIENHPSSLHKPRAQARLLALEEPAP